MTDTEQNRDSIEEIDKELLQTQRKLNSLEESIMDRFNSHEEWQRDIEEALTTQRKWLESLLSEEYDETSLVERTDVGVSITHEMKRGTGTRDQDKLVIKAKGHTLEDALADLEASRDHLEAHLDWGREVQPDQEGEDGTD